MNNQNKKTNQDKDLNTGSNIKNRFLSLELELEEKKKVIKLLEVKRKNLEESIKKINLDSNELNKDKIMVIPSSQLLSFYSFYFLISKHIFIFFFLYI